MASLTPPLFLYIVAMTVDSPINMVRSVIQYEDSKVIVPLASELLPQT
jgi:hypothetical protein